MSSFIQQENQKEFLRTLAFGVTGKSVDEYPSQEVASIITKCYDFMISWIAGKSKQKHPHFSSILINKQAGILDGSMLSSADEEIFHNYYKEFLIFLQQK